MRIYHSTLEAISQQSFQLKTEKCRHCGKVNQLVSHGFIYKCNPRHPFLPVGKRILCSARYGRTGCGRTTQLYLDTIVKHLRFAGDAIALFVTALIQGLSIQCAYQVVTHTTDARHAYRWLQRLSERLIDYRNIPNLAYFGDTPPPQTPPQNSRRHLITASFSLLFQRFGEPLCATFQAELQRTFF